MDLDFQPTAWTRILRAQNKAPEDPRRRECLEYLAQTYWRPAFIYIRSRCSCDEDALDLTQAYFTVFLEKDFLDQADRGRGRFRAFLLTSIKTFLANAADFRAAAKRAPKGKILSLDLSLESSRGVWEPSAPAEAPDARFMREWARSVMNAALARMEAECRAKKLDDYWRLWERHVGAAITDAPESHAEAARALGWTEAKVKKTLHRARKTFAAVLRAVVRESVETEADVEAELRDLRRYF